MRNTEIKSIPKLRRVFYDVYADLPGAGTARKEDLAYATDTERLYRWDGSAWNAITSPVGAGEGHIVIDPWNYNSIGQGTWGFAINTAGINNGCYRNSTGNDGDNLTYKVSLAKGTYSIRLIYRAITGGGICDLDVDGTEEGSQDMYNGTTLENQTWDITGVTVAAAGLYDLKLRLDGKNASSSAYNIQIHAIALWRTA